MTSGHEQEPAEFPDAEGRDPQETAGPVPGAAGEPAPSEEPVEAPVEPGPDELTAALAKVGSLTEDLQRLQAEYVNYKRRVDRDRELVEAERRLLGALLDAAGARRPGPGARAR